MTAESSVILGSVSYLSPEQVQRGVADARSDVYSTAIMAFEIFTGRKPYEGDEPLQIALKHVNERVPHINTLVDGIPLELDELIYRASSNNPDERPRDAAEFHSALQKISQRLSPGERQLSLELDIPIAPMRPAAKKKSIRKRISEMTSPLPTPALPEKTVAVATESTTEVRRKRKASKRVRRNRKIAVALAVALGIASWYVLIGPGSRVTIPGLVGATQSEVNAALSPLGLTSIVAEKQYSEEIPEGRVIETDPVGGKKIDQAGTLKLIISQGPERYTIPSLKGLTLDAAITSLKKLPLVQNPVIEVFNSEIPKGYVITSDPAAGVRVKRDSAITITLSKGIEQVALASYIGKSGDQALNELTTTGFNVTATYAFSEKILAGDVISQTPSAVAAINKGTKVVLVISKGTEFAYIPNLFSLEEARAVKALKDLGLKVSVKRIGSKTIKKVTSITPRVGTKVKRGSLVTIAVG